MMHAIGDKRDLQQVLDVVYQSALSTCGSRATAMGVVENAKIELLKLGLFVNFDGPPVGGQSGFAELATKNRAEGGCGCVPGTILCPH